MAKIVEITQQSSVSCKAGGEASAEFSVTNITDGAITVGVRVITDDVETESWFSPAGGPEWRFEQGENKPVHVGIRVPPNAAEGGHNFCIEVFSAEAKRGGMDFTTGEKMALQVGKAPPPPPHPVPWLWIALAAVLVLLVGGGTIWYLLTRVPDVTGKPFEEAVRILNENDYPTVVKEIKDGASGEAGIVVDQEKGDDDNEGKPTIILYVPGVTVPDDLVGISLQDLLNRLIEMGLGIKWTEQTNNNKPQNTVLWHKPAAGKVMAKGDVLQVRVSRKSTTSTATPTGTVNKVFLPTQIKQLQFRLREFERDPGAVGGQAPAQ